MEKVRQACMVHALRSLEYKDANPKLFKLHVNLLDQCAAVGRVKNGNAAPAEVERMTRLHHV